MGSFWQAKTKIRPCDKLFSEYIRRRDQVCQIGLRCGGSHKEWKELHCAHYHGRRKESVRFDPDNALALCPADHLWVDSTVEGKNYFDAFMEKRLGTSRYAMLELRANTPGKKDDEMTKLYLKSMLTSLQDRQKLEEQSVLL